VRAADVVVVGAGPAGSAAATVLARAGRDVVVVDKAAFPRDKCCGDGLTAAALRLLERLGLDPASVPSRTPVGTAVLHGPDHRRVSLPLPAEGVYSVVARRFELDAALISIAGAAGAEVRQGIACTGARAGEDRVVVSLADGDELHARYLIAADGMWSPVRKFLGAAHPGAYRGEWHAFRQYVRDVGPDAVDAQHVWFEADLLPGYAWSFPVGGGAVNVGFGVQRDAGPPVGDMGRRWADLLRRPAIAAVLGPRAVPEGPHRAWPIPARVDQAVLTAAGGRALFVGDAAAASDPLTGEGIGQALLTGWLAAEALSAGGPIGPSPAGRGYERAVRRELAVDHTFAARLSRLLRSPRTTRLALAAAGSSGWTRRHFARWMFEDYPRALLTAVTTIWSGRFGTRRCTANRVRTTARNRRDLEH
jgi:menaquinone-9 beta-reductase